MDAFYAAVEVLDDPRLTGRPLVVGGRGPRAVVSTASYEARRFGIRSGMPVSTARRLCPEAVILPVRPARYRQVSAVIMDIFHRYTPLVEPLSLDEAFCDVTASRRLFGPAPEIARKIKEEVRQETGLTVSAGMATSKLVAKIASDQEKPDGLTVVEPGTEREFLAPLPLGRLWGAGPKTVGRLAELGITTIGDLARLSRSYLTTRFGKAGHYLYQACRGIDPRPVVPHRPPKSVGHEETFAQDIRDGERLTAILLDLCGRVGRRLRQAGKKAGTVAVKVRYADFSTITRSKRLPTPTSDQQTLYRQARRLLDRTDAGIRPVRLLGVTAGDLVTGGQGQLALFATQEERAERLNRALDELAVRHGDKAPLPARLLRDHPSGGNWSGGCNVTAVQGGRAGPVSDDLRKARPTSRSSLTVREANMPEGGRPG